MTKTVKIKGVTVRAEVPGEVKGGCGAWSRDWTRGTGLEGRSREAGTWDIDKCEWTRFGGEPENHWVYWLAQKTMGLVISRKITGFDG